LTKNIKVGCPMVVENGEENCDDPVLRDVDALLFAENQLKMMRFWTETC
jgi:hypothetical protein